MDYVYDGSRLVQEHTVNVANISNEWFYFYDRITCDYMHKPGGTRQKEYDGQNYTDRHLIADSSIFTARVERTTSTTIERQELTRSGDRQAGGSDQDVQISNLASPGSYIESYGGGTSSHATKYFDPLVHVAGRHVLSGLGMGLSRMGNNAYRTPSLLSNSYGLSSGRPSSSSSIEDFDYDSCSICECNSLNWQELSYRCYRTIPGLDRGWSCHCLLLGFQK